MNEAGIIGSTPCGSRFSRGRYDQSLRRIARAAPTHSPMRVLLVLAALVAAVIALAGAVAGYAYHWTQSPLRLGAERIEVEIKPGSSVRSVARQLSADGVRLNEHLFGFMARLLRKGGTVKPGFYEIRNQMSPMQILDKMIRGDFIQSEVRFVEGTTFRQMRKLIEEHPDLRKETVGLAEPAVLKLLGANEPHAEGLFFPDTYVFPKGSTDTLVLRQSYQAMRKHLNAAWEARTPASPLKSAYQALVLASIIEKETGRKDDRPLIGAVFNNRLRVGMRLQADPTVIYGMGERFDGNIRKRDLSEDTPYNTYTRSGLPPTPIAMPGLAALRAAVQPAESGALYFVARGDGSSEFSRTLEEHNRAVSRYQRGGG